MTLNAQGLGGHGKDVGAQIHKAPLDRQFRRSYNPDVHACRIDPHNQDHESVKQRKEGWDSVPVHRFH
jgi:hypothetical protein